MTHKYRQERIAHAYQLDLLIKQMQALQSEILTPLLIALDEMSFDEMEELMRELPEGPHRDYLHSLIELMVGLPV